tara:strand:- start:294 stop:950 length:657 start_codon:yes stop_codon:yes gene_type:complete
VAVLNIRLLELIETLVAVRLDWLAFELIEEIQVGRSPEDTEEQLAAARQSIRNNAQPKVHSEPQAVNTTSRPIPVEDQIEWAVAYVDKRLDQAIEQQLTTINSLNYILANTTEQLENDNLVSKAAASVERDVSLVTIELDDARKINLEDIVAARNDVPALRAALAECPSGLAVKLQHDSGCSDRARQGRWTGNDSSTRRRSRAYLRAVRDDEPCTRFA